MDENSDKQGVEQESLSNLGRNEPCHCGSGKKFKRCHGVNAAPKLSPPKAAWGAPADGATGGAQFPGMPGGFDPSQMDPAMMKQFTQALQRLPRGQLQRLQGIMQRAMGGQDVSREAEDFERTLPVDIQSLMKSFAGQMGGGALPDINTTGTSLPLGQSPNAGSMMTEDQAREIVAAAAKEGRLSEGEAEKLLAASSSGTDEEKKKGFSNFWRGITGKSS